MYRLRCVLSVVQLKYDISVQGSDGTPGPPGMIGPPGRAGAPGKQVLLKN